ncbi:hypothetical protein [Niveibacterium sp. SC-1]|uniref:hypothetical protein n=1 Tax=Niveibacterium sp. SC-1 TaxID=3135646 RepID=UPI00311E4B34
MKHRTTPHPAKRLGLVACLLLAACEQPQQAPENPTPAPAKSVSSPDRYLWADFAEGRAELSNGVKATPGWYAEDKRDVAFDGAHFEEGAMRLTGTLRKTHESRYGGITVSLAAASAEGADMSAYGTLKLVLASSQAGHKLQVRLIGPNDVAMFRGCYPFATIAPTATPDSHVITLRAELFPALEWCKDLRLSFADTLKNLRAVEIIDATLPTDAQTPSAIDFSLKTVSFER